MHARVRFELASRMPACMPAFMQTRQTRLATTFESNLNTTLGWRRETAAHACIARQANFCLVVTAEDPANRHQRRQRSNHHSIARVSIVRSRLLFQDRKRGRTRWARSYQKIHSKKTRHYLQGLACHSRIQLELPCHHHNHQHNHSRGRCQRKRLSQQLKICGASLPHCTIYGIQQSGPTSHWYLVILLVRSTRTVHCSPVAALNCASCCGVVPHRCTWLISVPTPLPPS